MTSIVSKSTGCPSVWVCQDYIENMDLGEDYHRNELAFPLHHIGGHMMPTRLMTGDVNSGLVAKVSLVTVSLFPYS